MTWKKVKLKDCCSSISDGDHQPPPKSDTGVPFVTISNIKNNAFDFTDTMFVPMEYYEQLAEIKKPHKNDILLSVVGSYGIPVLMKNKQKFVFQRHIAILRPDTSQVDAGYLYYFMLNHDFYARVDAIAVGSAQKTLGLNALRNMEVRLPSLQVQQRVTAFLSIYDDLIENNRRQIKLLEEAAQRLYKEWFVNLRFPGYESVKIVDGVPDGWRVFPFSKKVDIMSGGTPRTEIANYYGGSIPFYTPKDNDGSFFAFHTKTNITKAGLENCNSNLYPENTIIITARGTVGKTVLLAVPMAMNQSCYAIKSDKINSPYFLFFSLRKEIEALKAMSNGSVFDTIIVKTFDSINITIPSGKIIDIFEDKVCPIMSQIKIKMLEIDKLQEARDRLLPKLMSGELEV